MISTGSRTHRFALGLCSNLTRWIFAGSVQDPTAPGVQGQSQQHPKRASAALAFWLHHFSWAHPLKPAWQSSLCSHCWLVLVTSPWPVLPEVSVTAHCHGFAIGFPDLLWGGVFGLFFLMKGSIPQRCWPGCEFILWRAAWEHSPCSMVWAEWSSLLPAHPEPALLCTQLSLLSKGTHKQSCTHPGMLRGPGHWNKASKQTKPTTKHTPDKWLTHPSLHSSVQAHGENLIENSLKDQQCT